MSFRVNPFDPGYFQDDELAGFGFKSVGKNVKIAKNCTIIGLENITLGNNIRIDGNVVISAFSGFLQLGNYVHVAGSCFLGCAGGITLLDFTGLSQGVKVFSGSDDYSGNALTNPTIPARFLNIQTAPVHLGRHVIIGSGSVILPGVMIGDGSAIGALSLVNKSCDSWGIYSGIPVRRQKDRSRHLLDLEGQLQEYINSSSM